MRILIARLNHETNSFSPVVTNLQSFNPHYDEDAAKFANGSNTALGAFYAYALAKKAVLRGAQVILVSGHTNLKPPKGLYKFISIDTAKEMYEAVMRHFEWSHIVIKSAAVADFSPKDYNAEKIKKQGFSMGIALKRNPDILEELGAKKQDKILVGFAAETQDGEKNALDKLRRKNLDFIVLNNVTAKDAGFRTDTNIVKILYKEGRVEELPKMLKVDLADEILDRIQMYVPQSRAN